MGDILKILEDKDFKTQQLFAYITTLTQEFPRRNTGEINIDYLNGYHDGLKYAMEQIEKDYF